MKIAFFDAKSYDMVGFDRYVEGTGMTIKYFETRLNEDTVSLADGYDAVCVRQRYCQCRCCEQAL